MIVPNFHTKKTIFDQSHGEFIIEPLASSFGNSLGNGLRRALLSSLKGMAITAVAIEDIPHLFSTIKGVKESALEIVLNLKQLRFVQAAEGKYEISLSKKGTGKIFGKDIEGEVKVINEDLYICEVTDSKGKLELKAIVEAGIGYVTAEEQENKTGYIAVDSSFSPVKKVNFKVEEARVGRKTNFDRLIVEIWTDGSITSEDALKTASGILADHFKRILSGEDSEKIESDKIDLAKATGEIDKKFSDLIVDELNLPSRVVNALLRENIETVADLIKVGKDKLIGLKGLGKKSIDLIDVELKKLGVQLQ